MSVSHRDSLLEPPDRSQAVARDRGLGVELRHLAALEAIAREGSFRGAADSLGYVQSAISQQISHLERLVGTRLVERARGSTPIALTEAGRLLLAHVDIILTRFEAAQSDLTAFAEGRAGTVRVGAFQSVATRVFPHVLPSFVRSAPDVQIVPTETQTDLALFGLVEEGDVDLAFCQLPLLDGPFESIELMDDPFVLLVAAGSPLAELEEPPSLEAVGRMPLIGFNESRAQDGVIEALRASDVQPEFAFRSDLNATVQALVAADIGVAIAPYLSVDPQHSGTTVLELPDLPPRKIALIWHRERERSELAKRFTDAVRATCARRFRHERSHQGEAGVD